MLDPDFRKMLERIRRQTRKPISSLIEEALRRYIEAYHQMRENDRFTRIVRAKARKIGVRTARDVERLVDSIRD